MFSIAALMMSSAILALALYRSIACSGVIIFAIFGHVDHAGASASGRIAAKAAARGAAFGLPWARPWRQRFLARRFFAAGFAVAGAFVAMVALLRAKKRKSHADS